MERLLVRDISKEELGAVAASILVDKMEEMGATAVGLAAAAAAVDQVTTPPD